MAEISTLDEKVPVNATVGQPNFTGAMAGLASSPSVMAQIGSQVASSATMKLMQEKGLELGKEPQWNLPVLPINNYLKQLESSYNAQSQAVLSLRAQDVINKANEEMAQNPSLSTGDIEAYKETLQGTLSELSKMAPTGVREQLQNSFESTLQKNTHRYVLKMNAQQRKEAADTQDAFIDSEQRKMQDLLISGDEYAAEDAYANAVVQVNERLAQKNMTPQEHEAKLRELDITYQQSKMLNEAFAAEKKHGNEGIEKYLAGMQDKKPDNMSYADYSVAMAGVAKAVNQREQLKASNRSMMISEAVANTSATGMPPSVQQIMALKDELTTQQFNETMLRINSTLNHRAKNEDAATTLYNNRSSAQAWLTSSGESQQKTFYRMTDDEINKARANGVNLTEVQAMTNTARAIPVPTTAYTNALQQKIGTGSAGDALDAAFAYRQMADGDPQDAARVSSLDNKAKVAASYMNFLSAGLNKDGTGPLSADEIVSQSREAAYKNEDEELLTKSYGRYYNSELQTSGNIDKYVGKVINKENLSAAYNASSLKEEVISVNKKFFMLSKGNQEITDQLTKDYFARYYGDTNINGRTEYVVNPTERLVSEIGASVPIIQQDIRKQLMEQLDLNNKSFIKGGQGSSNVFYHIETPKSKDGIELTYDNLYKMMDAAQKAPNTPEGKDTVNAYERFNKEFLTIKPIKVTVTRRDGGTEDMELVVYPSKSMQLSEDHNMVGGFDVGLRTSRGVLISFEAATPNSIARIHYNADIKSIRQMAGSIPNYLNNRAIMNSERKQQQDWNANLLARRQF